MYCKKCGELLTGLFCKNCGTEAEYEQDFGLHMLKAISLFMPIGELSAISLCRKMRVNMAKAKQLISGMESCCLIGPSSLTGKHKITVSQKSFESLVSSRLNNVTSETLDSRKEELERELAFQYINSVSRAFASFSVDLTVHSWRIIPDEKIQLSAMLSPGTHLSKALSLQTDIAFMVGEQGLRLSPDYGTRSIIIDIPLPYAETVSHSEPLDSAMDGHDFEYYVADVLSRNGFSNVVVTKGSGDFGVDITAEKGGEKYAIQCKRYSSPLGLKPIQEVYTGMPYYQCTKGVVVTNSSFTAAACELAANTGVILIDGSLLSQMAQS